MGMSWPRLRGPSLALCMVGDQVHGNTVLSARMHADPVMHGVSCTVGSHVDFDSCACPCADPVYPPSLYRAVSYASTLGVPVYILENGMPCAQDDERRTEWIDGCLAEARRACLGTPPPLDRLRLLELKLCCAPSPMPPASRGRELCCVI